jgi:uncharacterized protein YwqG
MSKFFHRYAFKIMMLVSRRYTLSSFFVQKNNYVPIMTFFCCFVSFIMTTKNKISAEQRLLNRIAPFKKTAWFPVVEKKTSSVLASKFSGIPLLAENETWPKCGSCHQEMQLFVQLNACELPKEAQQAFGGGILQVFYCTNFEQTDKNSECDAYFPFANSALLRILDPANIVAKTLNASPVIDAFEEKVIVGWQATDDYPDSEELEELGIELSNAESELLYEQGYPKIGDKLLGWPAWIQGIEYPDCPDCGDRMTLIFQLDSEDNVDYMFGDGGIAHVTQCAKHPDKLAIAWACC